MLSLNNLIVGLTKVVNYIEDRKETMEMRDKDKNLQDEEISKEFWIGKHSLSNTINSTDYLSQFNKSGWKLRCFSIVEIRVYVEKPQLLKNKSRNEINHS